MKRFLLVPMLVAMALPSFAADNLSKGIAFYNNRQYDKALAYLQDSVSKKPRDWHGRYYLANTYMYLGQRNEAFEQYQMCRTCNPTPDVAAACQKIVGQLAVSSRSASMQMPSYSPTIDSADAKYRRIQRNQVAEDAARNAQREWNTTMSRVNTTVNSNYGNGLLDNTATRGDNERARQVLDETRRKNDAMMEAVRRRNLQQ